MSSMSPLGWADSEALVDEHSLLWKQYVVYVDLVRFYVDIAWRGCVWLYAVTGVLLAFYFDRIGQDPAILGLFFASSGGL